MRTVGKDPENTHTTPVLGGGLVEEDHSVFGVT